VAVQRPAVVELRAAVTQEAAVTRATLLE
jgi:hypothetical protein